MTHSPIESFIIQRLQDGGWHVIHRKADLADIPIADFVSHREAEEWVNWKSGHPKINPYAMPEEAGAQRRVIEIAIEPKSKADQEKLGIALAKLAAEDPSFEVSTDPESGQTILKGVSERHLEIKLDSLRRTYKLDPRAGAPQVAFRETVTRTAETEYVHKKQAGRSGQFAGVKLRVEPNEPDNGYQFQSRIVGGAVPKEYIPGVEKGIVSVLSAGVVAGFPVVDIKVTLIDGKYHDVDSSALAFEIAARAAFREALQKAGPVLLEPIMKVEVLVPEGCVAPIIRDLNLRRAQSMDQRARGHAYLVEAMVPLMNMFGYADKLRSLSEGRATFTMQFDHYAPAPPIVPEDDPPFRPAIGMRA